MKAVMISIRPEWCEKILNGKKTVEIRKTRPKLETPFKVYIYCTKQRHFQKYSEHMLQAMDCLFKNKFGAVKFGDSFTGYDLGAAEDPDSVQILNGKVIAEFTCDFIYNDYGHCNNQAVLDDDMPGTGMTFEQYNKYCGGKVGYGWHISDLKIYDKPKGISEFKRPCKYRKDDDGFGCTCAGWGEINCPYQEYDANKDGSLNCISCRNGYPMKKAPQSWCYVEEREA